MVGTVANVNPDKGRSSSTAQRACSSLRGDPEAMAHAIAQLSSNLSMRRRLLRLDRDAPWKNSLLDRH